MIRSLQLRDFRRRLALSVALFVIAALWCWVEARAVDSKRSSYAVQTAHLRQMSTDAGRIERLRQAPQLAVERERPNDELLAEIQSAAMSAGLPLESWVGNEPQLAVRIPKSPYKRLSVRLLFEEITLRQLVQFAFRLTTTDPALSIPRVRLSAPRTGIGDTWNVDLEVSYLIYAPYVDH